jgi:sensor histidine kinase YesM
MENLGGAHTFGPPTPGNDITYFNLREGDYTFNVIASNSDGLWTDLQNATKLEIVVLPPWYRSWWFYTLLVFLFASILFAFFRYRIAQIRKVETFKRKEAEYKQLAAETETAVLRLQMNPHFIFNSMNSINNYILQKDIDTASDYLGRFSSLMRMILDFAARPFVSISDEIKLLDLYLLTEAMRFEKKFSHTFDLAEDFDPDEFVIPTMILQPFVENAVWHGLSKKKEKGHIRISFRQEDNSLICSVEDNGIGREGAKKNQKHKTHESRALSITERRLALLESKNGVTASYEIIDLYDNSHHPLGTKVIFRLPLL